MSRTCQSGIVQLPQQGVGLYYELHSLHPSAPLASKEEERIIMIMGFAAHCHAWYQLLDHLQTAQQGGYERSLQVLIFDNRGIGRSSTPADKEQYSTTIMAQDTLALMDHFGWPSAHVVGFSMGGMISTKLAALAPQRVLSLLLLGISGGGLQIVPRRWRPLKLAIRSMIVEPTNEVRARYTVKFHFSKSLLKSLAPHAPSRTVEQELYDEYVEDGKKYGLPPQAGMDGQGHACMKHRVTEDDAARIRHGAFPVMVVHGRNDIVAMPKFGKAQAKLLGAPFVLVNGAHLITRENADQVCAILLAQMSMRLSHMPRTSVVHLRGAASHKALQESLKHAETGAQAPQQAGDSMPNKTGAVATATVVEAEASSADQVPDQAPGNGHHVIGS